MKHFIISIFVFLFLGLNILFSQIVADTFNVPNYPIPEIYFTENAPELPDNAWNHKLKYFPDFYYNQHNLPNCGQAAGHFNCLTYEFNRLFDRAADSSTIFSPTHIFNFLNGGNGWYGVSTFDSWNVVKSQGDMVLSDYYELAYIREDEDQENPRYRGQYWQQGYNNYYNGMKNRISGYYSLDLKTDEDLKILMHYFNDHLRGDKYGGTAVFHANPSYVNNYNGEIIASISPDEQNVFEDPTNIVVDLYGAPTHSMILAGYCKNTFIDFNNDGIITDTIDINGDGVVDMHDNETILWIVINSWGDISHQSHFLFKYDLLAKVWNTQAFLPIPDTAYSPELTFKIKLKHPNRKDIKISAGISSDLNSEIPEQIIHFPIWNYQGGQHGMTGVDTLPNPDVLEFGIDISDIKNLKNGTKPYKIFMKLENTGLKYGELQCFSIIDYSKDSPDEHIIIENPVELAPISDNSYHSIFNLELEKLDTIIEITSPSIVRGYLNEQITTTLTPIDGQEPFQFHIVQNDEYSVSLSTKEYDFSLHNLYSNWGFDTFGTIYTSNPRIIEPNWEFVFAGHSVGFLSIEQSGTIAIDHILKRSYASSYPYQTLKKPTNYLQINPYLISEHDSKEKRVLSASNDTAIMIFERRCVHYGGENISCSNDYFAKITPDGKIEITYCDEINQNKIFANIQTNTNKYYIPYEQAIANTFNTVSFTPNPIDSLFTIDENGVLTMQAVSKPGKYETYVLVRDANGQEFTKRIEVNIINDNIIGNLYPNPTNNILYCDIYNRIEQDAIIEIFNIIGQLLYKQTPKLYAGINSYEFDVKQFQQGVYVLKVSFENKSQTQRFVVVK